MTAPWACHFFLKDYESDLPLSKIWPTDYSVTNIGSVVISAIEVNINLKTSKVFLVFESSSLKSFC